MKKKNQSVLPSVLEIKDGVWNWEGVPLVTLEGNEVLQAKTALLRFELHSWQKRGGRNDIEARKGVYPTYILV